MKGNVQKFKGVAAGDGIGNHIEALVPIVGYENKIDTYIPDVKKGELYIIEKGSYIDENGEPGIYLDGNCYYLLTFGAWGYGENDVVSAQYKIDVDGLYRRFYVNDAGGAVWTEWKMMDSAPVSLVEGENLEVSKGTFEEAKEGASIIGDLRRRKYSSDGIAQEGNVATGLYALAMGMAATATGDMSISQGAQSKVPGYGAVAVGSGAESDGYGAVAIGLLAKALADYTTVIGEGSEATGKGAVCLGDLTKASADWSLAIGYGVKCNGENSIAIGSLMTKADGKNAVAIGTNVGAIAPESVVIGSGNVRDNDNKYAIILANGRGRLNNALTIDWEDNAEFSGDVYSKGKKLLRDGDIAIDSDMDGKGFKIIAQQEDNGETTTTETITFPAIGLGDEIIIPINEGDTKHVIKSINPIPTTGTVNFSNSDGDVIASIQSFPYEVNLTYCTGYYKIADPSVFAGKEVSIELERVNRAVPGLLLQHSFEDSRTLNIPAKYNGDTTIVRIMQTGFDGAINVNGAPSLGSTDVIEINVSDLTESDTIAISAFGTPVYKVEYYTYKKNGTYTLSSVDGLITGMSCYVRLGDSLRSAGYITNISGNDVTVDGYIDYSGTFSDNTYMVIDGYPELGDTLVGTKAGLYLTSPNGIRFKICVDDNGNLTTTNLSVVKQTETVSVSDVNSLTCDFSDCTKVTITNHSDSVYVGVWNRDGSYSNYINPGAKVVLSGDVLASAFTINTDPGAGEAEITIVKEKTI